MKKEQLAINSVSTRNTDLVACLAAYRDAGFQNVEFMLSHVKDYMREQGKTAADVRRLLDNQGLRCVGGFEIAVQCFTAEPERSKNHGQIVENARLLSQLGATIMVVGTDGPEDIRAVEDPIEEIAGMFGKIAEKIRDTDVTLCIKFNWSPVVKSMRTAADIVRRTGKENIGVLFDLAHYHCTPTKFNQLSRENVVLIKHVHVDDMRDKPGELSNCNTDRVLPGQGCLDVRAILGQIESHDYSGYFAIEMFSEELWAMPADKAARKMYESLLPLCIE